MERVQKYFTKNLKGLCNKSYKERLAILNLPSLKCRCVFIDLVFHHNYIRHSLSDSKLQHLFPHTDLRTTMLHRRLYQLDLLKPRSDQFSL